MRGAYVVHAFGDSLVQVGRRVRHNGRNVHHVGYAVKSLLRQREREYSVFASTPSPSVAFLAWGYLQSHFLCAPNERVVNDGDGIYFVTLGV